MTDAGYRVAINGFGRVGRLVFRQLLEDDGDLRVVAINDIASLDELAYLLNHDSVYGEPNTTVASREAELWVGDRRVPYSRIADPARLSWIDLDVDIVIETSRACRRREAAVGHIDAGAERVVVASSSEGADVTVCMGVNEDEFYPDLHRIISSAGSTANCLALLAMVLDEEIGVESGSFTAMHAYTGSRSTAERSSARSRRGRAAAVSIAPSASGAADVVADVLPELSGKLGGLDVRVPLLCGSVIDLVIQSEQPTTSEQVNEAFRSAAETPELAGILGVREDGLVSYDVIGNPHSALIDLASTTVTRGHTVKVLGWYDYKWTRARRVIELAEHVAKTAAHYRSATRERPIQPHPEPHE